MKGADAAADQQRDGTGRVSASRDVQVRRAAAVGEVAWLVLLSRTKPNRATFTTSARSSS